MFIFGSLATGNVVQGNQIGCRRAKPRPGQLAAVAIQDASSNTVGGSTQDSRQHHHGQHECRCLHLRARKLGRRETVIAKNKIQKNLYGVLLYNAPNNGSYSIAHE